MNINPKIHVSDFLPTKPKNRSKLIVFHKPKFLTHPPTTKFIENYYEFLQNTTLHGLKYFGNRNLCWIERILFGIAFSIACIGAVYFILQSYRKWILSPIVIGTDTTPTYIDEIPFPAITICNMNQALKSKVQNINKTSKDYLLLQYACSRDEEIDLTEQSLLQFKSDWNNILDFIENVTQPCSTMLKLCKFGGDTVNCSDIFISIITDDGACCLFNGVGFNYLVRPEFDDTDPIEIDKTKTVPVDWSPERGYPKELPKKFYPRRGMGTGVNMGLSVILDSEYKEYYCSSSNSIGFKVLIHSPVEIPTIKDIGFGIDVGVESNIEIHPKLMKSTNSIRDINIRFRQCFFNDDIQQSKSIFRSYTKQNCEVHCEAMYVLQKCKCLPHYFAFFLEQRVCGMTDLACVFNQTRYHKTLHNESCSWICLPGCFDLNFVEEVVSTKIFHDGTFEIKEPFLRNISKDYITKSIAIVNFFYKESAFYGQIKQEYIGVTEFISNIGGIMGLFLGFSCISIIEIIYFTTLRPLCVEMKWRSGKK